MRRHIPNLLTAGRFILALALFVVLAACARPESTVLGLPAVDAALALFIVAALTDAVDGYLARRLGHLTTFGRIADPFVDKIIVCGTLVFLVGEPFVRPGEGGGLVNLSGWQTWMAVVIVARELLVTGMRSFSESHGIPFAATLSGKVKMFIQCVAVGWSLAYAGHWTGGPEWTRLARDCLAWVATLVTAASGLAYIKRAYLLLKMPPD